MISKVVSPQKALARLQSLCARSEHSSGEAYKKLATWGISPTDAKAIVESLIKQRYIDDSRFCRAFVNDKWQFARWGRRKIRAALILKSVDRHLIDEALSTIDEDAYYQTALHAINAKIKSGVDLHSFEGRTKLYRFGVSRGYEPDIISRAIRQMMSIESP